MKKLMLVLVTFLFLWGCSDDQVDHAYLEGPWQGSIDTPEMPLHIEVVFDTSEELSGVISIPVQGVEAYPLSNIEHSDEELSFDMEIPGQVIRFKADELSEERLAGTFHQLGQEF